MTTLTVEEQQRAATQYEQLMVPAFFEAWAERVVDVAGVKPGDRVLDVACGTGVVARAAIKRVGNGTVVGLDLNPGMLAVAKERAPDVEWQEGPAEDLPYDDNAFDVVICQFSLMFFPNQTAALQEMARVLVPGGRCVVSVFDSLDYVPGYKVLAGILDDVAVTDAAQTLRLPYAMGNTDALRALCADAGLSSVEITTHEISAHFPDIRTTVLAPVTGWFPFAGIEVTDRQLERVVERAKDELKPFVGETGQVSFPMRAHFIVAEKEMAQV